jgi:hypothetical protein
MGDPRVTEHVQKAMHIKAAEVDRSVGGDFQQIDGEAAAAGQLGSSRRFVIVGESLLWNLISVPRSFRRDQACDPATATAPTAKVKVIEESVSPENSEDSTAGPTHRLQFAEQQCVHLQDWDDRR